jgi:hypothetical protein
MGGWIMPLQAVLKALEYWEALMTREVIATFASRYMRPF